MATAISTPSPVVKVTGILLYILFYRMLSFVSGSYLKFSLAFIPQIR